MVAGAERLAETGSNGSTLQSVGALLRAERAALPIDGTVLEDVVRERAKRYFADHPWECSCAERPWKCNSCTYYNDYHWYQAETLVTLALTGVGSSEEVTLVNDLFREATKRRESFLEDLKRMNQLAESSS